MCRLDNRLVLSVARYCLCGEPEIMRVYETRVPRSNRGKGMRANAGWEYMVKSGFEAHPVPKGTETLADIVAFIEMCDECRWNYMVQTPAVVGSSPTGSSSVGCISRDSWDR